MDRPVRRKYRVLEQLAARDDEARVAQLEQPAVDDDRDGLPEKSRGVSEVSLDERDADGTRIDEQNMVVEQLEAALDKIMARQKIRAQALGFLLRKTIPAATASDPAGLGTLQKLRRVFRRKT
jgi:hypothetical protein